MTATPWLLEPTERAGDSLREAQTVLLGVPVTVSYALVNDELQRRADHDMGALLGYQALAALAQLPVDLPVPRLSLDADLISRLRRLPFGAIEMNDRDVTRRAVAAVRAQGIVHEGQRWSTALQRASLFAQYTQRTVALPRMPRLLARVRTEAAYYGVGVYADSGDERQWIARPAPFRPRCYSAASWLFDETVLALTTGRG